MKTFTSLALATLAYGFVDVQRIESDAVKFGGASNGTHLQEMTITENGQQKQVWVGGPDWYNEVDQGGVNLPEGARSYFLNSADYNPDNFYRPNLLGGSVSYDIDMSGVSCGCIAAFYLVKMPAHDWNGNPQQTDGWWYCDAQAVGGVYCPEFDIMEANRHAFQTTAHSCTYTGNGHYSDCDHGGHCIQNSVDIFNHSGNNAYGPGNWYTIDTTQPFNFKIDFNEDGGQFSSFVTTLSQNGKQVQTSCYDGSNNWMTEDIKDMAFAMSNWSGDATWLWKDACGGGCENPTIIYKNITITTKY